MLGLFILVFVQSTYRLRVETIGYLFFMFWTDWYRRENGGGEPETEPANGERSRGPKQGVEESEEHREEGRVLALHTSAYGLLPFRAWHVRQTCSCRPHPQPYTSVSSRKRTWWKLRFPLQRRQRPRRLFYHVKYVRSRI